MPRNDGVPPPFPSVDIKYRSGMVVRGVDPGLRRWTVDDPKFGKGYAYDIVAWQIAGK